MEGQYPRIKFSHIRAADCHKYLSDETGVGEGRLDIGVLI